MKEALLLQNILSEKGFKTLAAGGFVRDFLLKRDYQDIDLATEALPEQVKEILEEKEIKVIETGLKHGTVTAVLADKNYEITTLRIDKKCKGREAEVEFIKSFEEDAKRRDLTINSLFMDLNTQEIIDYVGGKKDLEEGILRFVGDPEKRITEDYLRLLRFYRFGAQLSLKLEEKSLLACQKYLPYLGYMSYERIRTEILKMIIGDNVLEIFKNHTDMVFTVFPELIPTYGFEQKCAYHEHNVYMHTLIGLGYLKKFKDPILSFAHLFHDVAKPYCFSRDEDGIDHFYRHEQEGERVVNKVCCRLKFSIKDTKKIKFLVYSHMKLHQDISKKAMRRLILRCNQVTQNKDTIYDLIKQHEADLLGMREFKHDLFDFNPIIKEALTNFDVTQAISPLSGQELMEEFSLKPGPKIGILKEILKQEIIDGRLDPSDKEAALKFAKNLMAGSEKYKDLTEKFSL